MSFKSWFKVVAIIAVIVILVFGFFRIRGCVHYNVQYKRYVNPKIEKVNIRISELEKRIVELETKQK
jgi:hypothetical protein